MKINVELEPVTANKMDPPSLYSLISPSKSTKGQDLLTSQAGVPAKKFATQSDCRGARIEGDLAGYIFLASCTLTVERWEYIVS